MPTGWVKRNPARYGKSGWEWQRTRTRVLQRDSYVCRYCGGKATTADHVLGKSFGGTDTMDNLVASCAPCNEKRRIQQSVQGRKRVRTVTRW